MCRTASQRLFAITGAAASLVKICNKPRPDLSATEAESIAAPVIPSEPATNKPTPWSNLEPLFYAQGLIFSLSLYQHKKLVL